MVDKLSNEAEGLINLVPSDKKWIKKKKHRLLLNCWNKPHELQVLFNNITEIINNTHCLCPYKKSSLSITLKFASQFRRFRPQPMNHHQLLGNAYVDYSTEQWPSIVHSEHSYHFSNDQDVPVIDHLLLQFTFKIGQPTTNFFHFSFYQKVNQKERGLLKQHVFREI